MSKVSVVESGVVVAADDVPINTVCPMCYVNCRLNGRSIAIIGISTEHIFVEVVCPPGISIGGKLEGISRWWSSLLVYESRRTPSRTIQTGVVNFADFSSHNH